ncbi:MAG: hypothetical protein AMXMBFR47_23170 [Planctomycetota bacterium]
MTLDTCLTQYFYQYYATAKDCPIDADLKAELRRLKALSNCDMLAGKVLESQIRLHLGRGADWSPAWFIKKALGDFDRIVSSNRAGTPSNGGPDGALLEFVNADPVADEKAARAREKLLLALRYYFEAPALIALRESAKGATFLVGKKLSGLRIRNWTISGEIDLLIKQPDHTRIIDWKIGLPQGPMDSLQLFVYAWFATNDPAMRSTTITAQRAFLGSGELESPIQVTAEHTRRGRARILQDIELMDELDTYGRDGADEVFTPCMKENVCRRCKFQRVCPKATAPPTWKQTSVCLPLFQAMS